MSRECCLLPVPRYGLSGLVCLTAWCRAAFALLLHSVRGLLQVRFGYVTGTLRDTVFFSYRVKAELQMVTAVPLTPYYCCVMLEACYGLVTGTLRDTSFSRTVFEAELQMVMLWMNCVPYRAS